MKNKLTYTIVLFLLLIPFRLPISILMIRAFEWLVSASTSDVIPVDVLATNVIVTKMIYNIALASLFVYNIEKLSREKLGRNPRANEFALNNPSFFWWSLLISFLMVAFIIIDAFSIHNIFFNQPTSTR